MSRTVHKSVLYFVKFVHLWRAVNLEGTETQVQSNSTFFGLRIFVKSRCAGNSAQWPGQSGLPAENVKVKLCFAENWGVLPVHMA